MARKKEKINNNIRQLRIDDLKTFEAITKKQQDTFKNYDEGQNLLLHGLAGTGKTFISLYLALEEVMDASSDYSSIYIVRSTVPTREMGFLPGNEEEKIGIYEAPYRSICRELFDESEAYNMLKRQKVVNFISTSYIRGLTINNSIVIVDEMQNLNLHELDSIITRLGKNSKIIFCGDYTQTDLIKQQEKQGIVRFMEILNSMNHFSSVEFGIDDIVRSPLIKEYIVAKHKLGVSI
jgi:predicted ribonuclease YlaK